MYTKLKVILANPADHSDTIDLNFNLIDHHFKAKWCERLIMAQSRYKIDHPDRFYGFSNSKYSAEYTVAAMNNTIDKINGYVQLIDRHIQSVDDQDTLNYLHHMFEIHHGLVETQHTNKLLVKYPELQPLLCEINLLVHRIETLSRTPNHKRFVTTYYGLPKSKSLTTEDFSMFTLEETFGTVYLNYCDIGKQLEDLALDNDQYIADDAFVPFTHYSADFVVRFWDTTADGILARKQRITTYYQDHYKFFKDKEYAKLDDPRLAIGNIPLATLEYTSQEEVLAAINTHLWQLDVQLS